MKFIIPNYRTPDSFVDNVAFTLIKMGHEVKTMPRLSNSLLDNKVFHLMHMLKNAAFPQALTFQEKWLMNELESNNKYNVLLTLTQSLPEELLFLAKKKGLINIVWWGDTPSNMNKYGLLVDGWDKIFIKDSNAAEKMKGLGLDAELLHEAMNPEWHKPLYKNIGKDLIVAGSFYDYRNYLVKKLLERNVDICSYGRKLPKWINKDTTKTYMNKFIVREEKSKIFGQGLACLNSTAMSEFNSLNCRAFEIAGAEGLHFLEYRPAVEACFDIDKEVKVFRSIEELMTLIEWAKNFPSEAQIVRKNARKRALFEHTYENRLVTIINSIK